SPPRPVLGSRRASEQERQEPQGAHASSGRPDRYPVGPVDTPERICFPDPRAGSATFAGRATVARSGGSMRAVLLSLLLPSVAEAATITVGPGQAYANV